MKPETQDPEQQYVSGQLRSHFPSLLRDFETASIATLAAARPEIDLPYGPHPRQIFDFYPATSPAKATLLYFHAGYWQGRDKSLFRFIAPPLTAAGLNVALINYPLCPDVTLAELVDAARASVPAVAAHSQRHDAAKLILCGHSAGGHLAVELGLTDWAARGGLDGQVGGIVSISGVFDLRPLVDTSLNVKLRLDAEAARRASPLFRVVGARPRAVFAVGGAETQAFVRQSTDMAAAWAAAGNESRLEVIEGEDHFSILAHGPRVLRYLRSFDTSGPSIPQDDRGLGRGCERQPPVRAEVSKPRT